MNLALWRGRRVLLTGHSGFKGGWLALWLSRLGAQVTGFSLPPPATSNLFELARVAGCTDSHFGDIRDAQALSALVEKSQPEIVFHLAAQPLVRRSYADPLETFSTNVMGTAHLLDAIRLKSPATRAIVIVTTDKCYENREWAWGYRESDPLGGHDPYSSSKAGTEMVAHSYAKSFFSAPGMPALATARAGNVIGGGDWAADRLVPDLLAALLAGEPARIRNPNATRPWQHVLEPLRGYLLLAERLHAEGRAFAEAWNFGPVDDDARPVQWIATELARLWGGGATWVTDPGEHPHEAHYLKLDISKARARLPWKPALRLADALQLTVDWARQHQAGQDMQAATLAQIERYQALPH